MAEGKGGGTEGGGGGTGYTGRKRGGQGVAFWSICVPSYRPAINMGA